VFQISAKLKHAHASKNDFCKVCKLKNEKEEKEQNQETYTKIC